MNIGSIFDPTSDNFLGGGIQGKAGRGLADVFSFGAPEWLRAKPLGAGSNTLVGKIGHGIGGAGEGAAGGFVTGGIPGAAVGGVTGGVRSGLGDSDPTSAWGRGGGAFGNFGIGAGEGALTGSLAGTGMFSGSGGTAMTPYMPTSTPVMSQAGSTLGGGMTSPLNAGGPAMGSAPAASSPVTQALNYMRLMQGGGQQQQQAAPQQSMLEKIYAMYPQLKPHIGRM